jgi:hypothetical protein
MADPHKMKGFGDMPGGAGPSKAPRPPASLMGAFKFFGGMPGPAGANQPGSQVNPGGPVNVPKPPIQGPKFAESNDRLGQRQRKLVRSGVREVRAEFGKAKARTERIALVRGIQRKGKQRGEKAAVRRATKAIKRQVTPKEGVGWKRAYRKAQG